MNMTREDVLRELELLPVWKLRAPSQVLEAAPAEKTEAIAAPVAKKASYEITISDDKNWCFICQIYASESRMDTGLQATLLSNILHALHIEKSTKIQVENLQNIDAKMFVAMGEAVAQALLNSQETLENLRGKLHASNIIATYDLAHLLVNPADKAKTWADLCMAKIAISTA